MNVTECKTDNTQNQIIIHSHYLILDGYFPSSYIKNSQKYGGLIAQHED
jgi:hypothetical protein